MSVLYPNNLGVLERIKCNQEHQTSTVQLAQSSSVSLCSTVGLLLAFLLPSCGLLAMSLSPTMMVMLLLAAAVVTECVLAAGDDGGIAAHPVYVDEAGALPVEEAGGVRWRAYL